ncbi:hypothetical protein ACN47E_007624 [Coniothyrium glycines]
MNVQAALNPADLFSAKGLVVVITGGGSGIGLAIASTLYQNGAAKVYIIGRRRNVLEDAIKSLGEGAGSVLTALPGDVTDLQSVRQAVAQIKQEVGWVDVLINNAGVLGPKNGADIYKAESIEQLSEIMVRDYDGWAGAMAINTQAVIGVSATFLPLLEQANVRRGWASGKVGPAAGLHGTGTPRKRDTSKLAQNGIDADDDRLAHIITVASVASFMRWVSAGLAYNASKSAAAHLGKMMASFLADWGIRSNIVCPGPYPSEMTNGIEPSYSPNQVPQGRMGGINDMAALTLFLVGKGGAYVNGTTQLTDGGRTSQFPAVY